MSRPRRVYGYARVSSEEQALGSSLRDQQASIAAYAKSLGLEVTRFFVEAQSGIRAREEQRVEMQALLAIVKTGDLVLCDKIDRWSRDAEFSYGSVRRILEAGASVYAVGLRNRRPPASSPAPSAAPASWFHPTRWACPRCRRSGLGYRHR